jgi:RNA polymerase sigma factor (sigma-70 family)
VKKAEDLDGIIEGCKRNERRAQEQLFKLFFGKMLAVSLRYISDRDSAQDVVQDGFIKIFEHIGNFDQKGSIEGWMRRIIANQAIDYIRKKKKESFLVSDDNEFRFVADEPEDIENWNMTTESRVSFRCNRTFVASLQSRFQPCCDGKLYTQRNCRNAQY